METAVCEYGEEEYIEMEVSSSPPFSSSIQYCCSSPQSREEFEFQMCTTSAHTPTTTSPADHLFHKGKLLPLYLLHPAATTAAAALEEAYYSLPFTAPSTNTANTPLDSSPPESRRVSCDLNSDDYFFEWSKELNTFTNINHPTKISIWPKKLNLIKNSILAHKLRASKAYLKSLFVKSACSSKQEILFKNSKTAAKLAETAPYPTIAAIINNIEKESVVDINNNMQRRSFSSAIKRHSPTKCLSSSSSNSSSGSSSFSLNSNGGLHELRYCLRRSSSATEIEGSIEAAIAHCKKSHLQIF